MSDIEQARQRFQACLDELSRRTDELNRHARTFMREAEQEQARRELADFARSDEAPPELRRLQMQIDRGELSWYSALFGEANGVMDESARRFLEDRTAGLPALGEALRSGASVAEAVQIGTEMGQAR